MAATDASKATPKHRETHYQLCRASCLVHWGSVTQYRPLGPVGEFAGLRAGDVGGESASRVGREGKGGVG